MSRALSFFPSSTSTGVILIAKMPVLFTITMMVGSHVT